MLSKERVPGAGFTCIGVALFASLRAKYRAGLKAHSPGQKAEIAPREKTPGQENGQA